MGGVAYDLIHKNTIIQHLAGGKWLITCSKSINYGKKGEHSGSMVNINTVFSLLMQGVCQTTKTFLSYSLETEPP